MTDNAPPSAAPADYGSLPGLLRIFGEKMAQNLDVMLPARVIAYDRATNRATVQPLVQMVTTQGERVTRAQVPSVPVFQYAGGGFVISLPLAPGDLGWLMAADRDLSLALQTLSDAPPNTARTHSFQDGVFYPDIMRSWSLNGDDAERLVLQSTDGETRVAIGQGVVAVTTGGEVTVDAPSLTATVADAEITASASITLTAPTITINGAVVVNGALSATGGVTGSGGLSLETHRHTGVTIGAGTTGGPTP